MTYDPREDSDFLATFVKKHARGRVLDMGTGAGVQAFAALDRPDVEAVVAVDVDPEAVEVVKKRKDDRLTVKRSDLFSELEGETFDTIVCNPPYLPDERLSNDPALYGGPHGYEFIERFLKRAREHLAEDGQILLLFSSLTNKERVDGIIKREGYRAEQLGELAMFFERLYVYRLR